MKFEDIAKELSKEENRFVSVYAVRMLYYKGLNKLRRALKEDPVKYEEMKQMLIEDPSMESEINDIIDNMVKYRDE